jgi:hypothetical protein
VEEVVAFLAGDLEAGVAGAFSRDNGLLTFAADEDSSEFHRSPFSFCLPFSEGHLVS